MLGSSEHGLGDLDGVSHFIVTEGVQSLPDFDLGALKAAVVEVIESELGGWELRSNILRMFEFLGNRLVMALDGDELVYDLGASNPSSPFRVLTVMLASEGAAELF